MGISTVASKANMSYVNSCRDRKLFRDQYVGLLNTH